MAASVERRADYGFTCGARHVQVQVAADRKVQQLAGDDSFCSICIRIADEPPDD